MHTFKNGDKVAILNTRFSGELIVEGHAVILKPVKGVEETYRVRFLRDGEPQLGEEYSRYVDRAAQANPEAYVAELNAGRAA